MKSFLLNYFYANFGKNRRKSLIISVKTFVMSKIRCVFHARDWPPVLKIFERIQLPEETFEMHLLEWFLPEQNESLEAYAKRMTLKIKHENPVLIGVSFGGILVQEMARIIPDSKNDYHFECEM